MIPFYIFYSMFGFQRTGDLMWLAGDIRAKGFIIGGTAPMVAAMLNSFSIEPKPFIATLGLVLALQHGLKVIVFWFLGFNYLHYLPLMILAILAGMLGTYLGVKIMYRLKNELISKMVKFTLIFLAFRLIYLGAASLIFA